MAVIAARRRVAASSATAHATMMRAGSFSRLLAWIWRSRLASCATGVELPVEDRLPRLRPSAVGAMSTIETSPSMRVVGDVSRPWKPRPITAIG